MSGQFRETFLAATWADHLRQHERMSVDDAAAQAEVFGLAAAPVRVRHLIAARPGHPEHPSGAHHP
jgi:hypothetical protein